MRTHLLALLVFAGCGDSSEPSVYDDTAQLIGSTIATPDGGALRGAVGDSIVLAFGGMPAGFTEDQGAARGSHGTLEHLYIMVQCRDREGHLIKPCTQLTDTATLVSSWSGSIDRGGLAVTQSRQGMWSLDNLQTWMPTVRGSSQLRVAGTIDDRAYELTATGTETMAIPEYMMGGAIHLDVTLTGDDTAMVAEIVFDDQLRSAALTVDEHSYRIDLTTGAVVP